MIDPDELRLAFCGLHPDHARRLVEDWGSPGAVLRAIVKRQITCTDAVVEAGTVPVDRRRAELSAMGIEAVTPGTVGYPQRLADLPDAPRLLFVRGEIPTMPHVAVVGTRRCTSYGRRLARTYGEAIAAAGWSLVSGLARGIDGAAHEGTAAAGGPGVAVLGSGIDVWYPREHQRLGEHLLASGGAIVSEAPPGAPPEPWRFPPRNRIISGMASVVVVVEAGVTGGALITASAALTQGVPVFAVPGDVDRATSRGCNLLIRDGAQPVFDAVDLIEEVSLVVGPPSRHQPRIAAADASPLGPMLAEGGRSIEDLAAAWGRSIAETIAEISRLEAAGLVQIDRGAAMPT